jgi:hypothetical protein
MIIILVIRLMTDLTLLVAGCAKQKIRILRSKLQRNSAFVGLGIFLMMD